MPRDRAPAARHVGRLIPKPQEMRELLGDSAPDPEHALPDRGRILVIQTHRPEKADHLAELVRSQGMRLHDNTVSPGIVTFPRSCAARKDQNGICRDRGRNSRMSGRICLHGKSLPCIDVIFFFIIDCPKHNTILKMCKMHFNLSWHLVRKAGTLQNWSRRRSNQKKQPP